MSTSAWKAIQTKRAGRTAWGGSKRSFAMPAGLATFSSSSSLDHHAVVTTTTTGEARIYSDIMETLRKSIYKVRAIKERLKQGILSTNKLMGGK
ncbi:hypothetical protein QJS10_CPB11g01728 [Acorus calamus]|uniref:Uncharacterized protein n=1 Tax=Acorus calamus TaxID=4465 RepID=A0AAV9DSI1_ACOCL|nr:hypothetical protein QJS10_CPB11g01728 [Acorus calamus]